MGSTLSGKHAIVFGAANRHSIGWAIAEALHAEGARVGLVYRRAGGERRLAALARAIDAPFLVQCDVRDDSQIEAAFRAAQSTLGPRLEILVHAIANAPAAALAGRFVDTTRDDFAAALDTSAYSLVALARAAEPMMTAGGSVIALSAIGGQRVLPHYNVMGVAKAALESAVRYLAADLGPAGIRVNAISAGAIRTVAAVSVPGFRAVHRHGAELAPLRQAVTAADVGEAVAWLSSDAARRITGQVIAVDAGWSILGLTGAPAPRPNATAPGPRPDATAPGPRPDATAPAPEANPDD